MGQSFRRIDYYLRLAKTVERNMILEVLKDLCGVNNSENYQYVGMGSIAFVDFRLFYKEIGFSRMISIESAETRDRFLFNIPFNCIEMKFGLSNRVLPHVDFSSRKSIVWLDYDGGLKNYFLEDVETIAAKAKNKNVYLVTWQKELDKYVDLSILDKEDDIPLEEKNETIKQQILEFNEKFGTDATKEDFNETKTGQLTRQLIIDKINETLTKTNSGLESGKQLKFLQLFYYNYNDGAPMQTFGGIFITREEEEDFRQASFWDYDFIIEDENHYNILIPKLTKDEVSLLNRFLPEESLETFIDNKLINIIPQKELKQYYDIYRFFPNFMDIKY